MKKILAFGLIASVLAPALAQTNVGISIGVYQPGVYGRIDIGNSPQPRVVYPEPVVIVPPQLAVQQQPIYLYVPPGHRKNWARHCIRYNACGQPVYFVQEDWIRERYEENRVGRGEGGYGRGDERRERHGGRHRDE
jgi:hypothetical protein